MTQIRWAEKREGHGRIKLVLQYRNAQELNYDYERYDWDLRVFVKSPQVATWGPWQDVPRVNLAELNQLSDNDDRQADKPSGDSQAP